MDFNEDFLHFIWRFRLFNSAKLVCAGGEELQILHPGTLNMNSGPDFNDAKLIIDQTSWVGHVEIHLKSSDWLLHGHQRDVYYDGVILHVVYQYDIPIHRTNGSVIPVLVLEGLFSEQLFSNYNALIGTVNQFPCEKQIGTLDPLIVDVFLSRVVIERFEQKSIEIFEKLATYSGDWEQTFYCFLARNFGFKVNGGPFDLLASTLPYHVLLRHQDNPMQIEALLFGQAGFLEQDFFEDYPRQLKREYGFLKKKYQLRPMEVALWKFLRMRPQNFPTIRLAQFAALMLKADRMFSRVINASTLSELYVIFEDLMVNKYWQTHYHFNKKARQVVAQPGRSSVHNLIINSVCLFLFCYGRYTGLVELAVRAIDFLEKIPAEHNAIVSQYRFAGLKVNNAFVSQALLHLNKCYCNQKKCLNCAIGIKILKK